MRFLHEFNHAPSYGCVDQLDQILTRILVYSQRSVICCTTICTDHVVASTYITSQDNLEALACLIFIGKPISTSSSKYHKVHIVNTTHMLGRITNYSYTHHCLIIFVLTWTSKGQYLIEILSFPIFFNIYINATTSQWGDLSWFKNKVNSNLFVNNYKTDPS